MSTPAPTVVRALQVVAVALAIAIVALFVAWTGKEPGAPPNAGEAQAAAAKVAEDVDPAAGNGPAAESPGDAATRAADQGAANAAAVEDASAVLYGTVKSADGEPVDGVLWLYREDESLGSASLGRGTTTFAFGGLRPGAYRFSWRFTDQLQGRRTVEVAAPRTRFDLELPARWRLLVHAVTPDGAPLGEALGGGPFGARNMTVLALDEPLAGDLPPSDRALGGGLGVFRAGDPFGGKVLPKTAVGVLALPPDRPVHTALLLRNVLLGQQVAQPGQEEMTFTLPADALQGRMATVRVRTVDERGAPVAGARVSLNDGQTSNSGSKTDEQGRIEFTKVTPGRVHVGVWHQELCAPSEQIDVGPGSTVDLGDLTLRAPVSCQLSFEGFEGRGSVYLWQVDLPQRPGVAPNDRFVASDNGKLQPLVLYPGRYVAMARGKNGVAVQVLDTAVLAGQTIRFDLAQGAKLRLVAEGAVLPRRLQLRTSDGLPVSDRSVEGTIDYSIELPPGGYVATVTHPDRTVTRHAIALPREGTTFRIP